MSDPVLSATLFGAEDLRVVETQLPPLAPGMVVFLHMILMDSDAGVAACPGRTVLVTEGGCEPLSAMPLALVPG